MVIYAGAWAVERRNLFWNLWITVRYEVFPVPQSWIPYLYTILNMDVQYELFVYCEGRELIFFLSSRKIPKISSSKQLCFDVHARPNWVYSLNVFAWGTILSAMKDRWYAQCLKIWIHWSRFFTILSICPPTQWYLQSIGGSFIIFMSHYYCRVVNKQSNERFVTYGNICYIKKI